MKTTYDNAHRLGTTLRSLSYAVLVALAGGPIAAQAQVTPAAGAGIHRPGTDTAANGVPVVNIVAPSAAGVSHNQYDRYDVDRRGVILNNSAAVSATQQAGYIVGNPNLQGGQAARLIVNEVTSTNPSRLNGYTEVAGNRADVIIANPNGISCDGCGFINTSRGVLTTGTPVFGGDGSLAAFRVTRGAIDIAGSGLDATHIDRLDLIARSVAANAKIWANQLNVIAGANQVGHTDLSTQAIAGEAAPGVAIDVAALGGMYANKIRLIGTEAGVGVRVAGELASAGDFEITSAGQLTLTGKAIATGGLTVNAASLDSSGTLYSGGPLHLSTGDLASSGLLASAADLTVRASSLRSTGTLGAGLAADGSLVGTGGLDILVSGALIATGTHLAAGRMALAGGTLDLSGAHTRAGGDLWLSSAGTLGYRGGDLVTAGALAIDAGGDLDLSGTQARAGGDLSLTSGGALGHRGGDLAAGGTLSIAAGGVLDNTSGRMQATRLAVQAAALINRGGNLLQTGIGSTSLAVGGLLDNAGGLIASNGADISVSAAALDNTGGAIEHAGSGTASFRLDGALNNTDGRLIGNGALALVAGNVANVRGTLNATRDATLQAGGWDNTGGTVLAQALHLVASGAMRNAGGTVQATDALSLWAASLDNGNGRIAALGGPLALTVTQGFSNAAGGFIGGNAAVNLSAGRLDNDGQLYAGDDLTVLSQGDARNTGALQAGGSATIAVAGALDNRGGRIEAGSDREDATLSLRAAALNNSGGRIANAAQGATTVQFAGALINTGGTLGGQGDVSIVASDISNDSGTLVATKNMTVVANSLRNAGGILYAAQDLGWTNASAWLDNTDGQLGAGRDLNLTAGTLINERGQAAANHNATLQLGAFSGIGRVQAGNDLAIRLPGDYTNLAGNLLQAAGVFRFDLGGGLVNAANAVLDATDGLIVSAGSLTNAGLINSASTTLNLRGDLANTGRIDGDDLLIQAANVDNTGTLMGYRITVRANHLTNGADLGTAVDNNPYASALIAATERIALYVGGTVLNRDALIYSMGDLVIAGGEGLQRSAALINRSGSIEADGHITLAANQITNERRVFETSTHVLTEAERAQNTQTLAPQVRYRYDDPNPLHHPPYVDPSQVVSAAEVAAADVYCVAHLADNYRCIGYPQNKGSATTFQQTIINTVISRTQLDRASKEGKIAAGGDIAISGSLLNDKSQIAAGNNLSINGQSGGMGDGTQLIGGETVRNVAWTPTAQISRGVIMTVQFQYLVHDPRRWVDGDFEKYGSSASDFTLGLDGELPPWITLTPGPGVASTITAGGGVTIIGSEIKNITVDADGKPVAGNGIGQNAGSKPVTGNGPGSGAQIVGDNAHPIGAITLPEGGLYTVRPGAGSSYLIETDPRFASQSGFLGSDYLMDRLGFNGETMLKRLGDAFYETRLVLDQITSLTGRRYLGDNRDAIAQYRELMDAGADVAQSFDLAVGVALTPQQMASLTQDIVWMVSQQVNGESVLVPVVYLSAATANNAASGASISGNSVAIDASGTLTNTGSIKAQQEANLKAGTLLNAGQLAAGGTLSVNAAQDILNTGSIKAGNVALVAGNDILSTADRGALNLGSTLSAADAQRLGLSAAGSISATGDLTAQAGRDLTLSQVGVSAGGNLGLAAGRDLTATAATLSAGNNAQLSAGNDLSLNAIGRTEAIGGASKGIETTTHTVTTVTAGGSAILAAGRDLSSQGAQLSAGDVLAVSAGRDVTLNAVTDTLTQKDARLEGKTQVSERSTDELLRGSSLDAGNGLIVSAGRDLTTTAATLTSEQGGIALAAGRDINLNAGVETHTWEQDTKTKKSGTLSSTTTRTHDASEDKLAIGTLISGDSVTVAAGRDLTTQAAQIGATHDVILAAGNNLTIGTATSTHSETHDKTVKKTGVMSNGIGVMLGQSKESQGYQQTDTTPTGSLIGSTDGRVTLSAGNTVHITGSDILSQAGTAIVGKNVTIDAAVGTTETTQTYKKQSAGITLGVAGGAAAVAQNVYGGVKRGSEVKDDRLKALYAAQAAQTLFSPGAAQQMGLGAGQTGADAIGSASQGNTAGMSLRLGIGASSASSEARTHDELAYGSAIRSNGNVTIAATGGDLNIVGSQVSGTDVGLAAAHNINLLSQAEQHTSASTSKNGSGEVGVTLGSETGFYATASAGRGKGQGNGTTHAETLIDASGALTLVSGNDTTIKGAQLKGDSVLAAIGGNLLIQSEQDTDDVANRQQQIGGTFVYGSGGSVNYDQSKIDSHYTSVNEVSGISAGNGGFQIAVGGNTHLAGGVIASSADPSKNLLNTGSLSWEDLHNEASYSASSIGIGGGYSASGGGIGGSGISAAPSGLSVPQQGHSSSDTQAGIANGTIIVRDGPVDLSALKRNPTLDNQALAGIFDEEKIRENMELGQLAGQVGFTAVGDYGAMKQKDAEARLEQAKIEYQRAYSLGDSEGMARAVQDRDGAMADFDAWRTGGTNKTVLHAATGAAMAGLGGGNAWQGGLGAGGAQFVLGASHQGPPSSGLQWLSTAIGGAIGGGSGAAAASAGYEYNEQLHYRQRPNGTMEVTSPGDKDGAGHAFEMIPGVAVLKCVLTECKAEDYYAAQIDLLPMGAEVRAAELLVKELALGERGELAAEKILGGDRLGSGLKADPSHRAASFLSKEQLDAGQVFSLRGGDGVDRTLLQAAGQFNGKNGIYEFIYDSAGKVTHQRFIEGGSITGLPNQRVIRRP